METSRSEELIREFYRAMCREGVAAKSAARHRDKLRFFLHAYLAEEWPRELDRLDGDIIRDFLGQWFLRHVGGSKNDLVAYLNTFRAFYEYLYQSGRISFSEYDELLALCASDDYFLACYDELAAARLDPWSEFAAGRPLVRAGESLAPGLSRPVDRQLWMLAHNLGQTASAVLDFALFLDYLSETRIKLSRARSRFPGRHLELLNQRFSSPEDLPRKPRLEDSVRVNWFFHLALALGLARVTEAKSLEVPPGVESWLDLKPDTQLAVMIDAAWNLVPWAELANPKLELVSQWAQEHREGFAALLADLAPGREWPLDPDPAADRQDALLARYILFHEAVENAILFALQELGILQYSARKILKPGELKIKAITMTRFGRQAMRLYARRAARDSKAELSPLADLQQCLFLS